MKFKLWLEDRTKGEPLNSPNKTVRLYRATDTNMFYPMDFVTLSWKFAKKHAEHQAAYTDEPCNIISAIVKTSDVYDAYNPGEYFYDGPEIIGKVVYIAKPEAP